jgi:hypothetical protein
LLKVSTKALFGKKKQIEKHIRKLGIGRKSNTSRMERLNGTIRGQQARLAGRPAVWSRKGQKAFFGWKRALVRLHRDVAKLQSDSVALHQGIVTLH